MWGLCLCPAGLLAAPESGLWFDPDRSGNGLDLHRTGNVLFGAFYTYDLFHAPEWLWIQTVDADAPSGTLTRFRKVNGQLVPGVAGNFTLTPVADCQTFLPNPAVRSRYRMDFILDGRTYRWCMEPLLPATRAPQIVLSGAWFNPVDPGWGLFAHHYPGLNGQTQTYRTVYYHNSAGDPRWSFAQDALQGSIQTQLFYSSRVECYGCGASPPLTIQIGSANISLVGAGAAPGSNRINVSLSFDGEPAFVRNANLVLLSDPNTAP